MKLFEFKEFLKLSPGTIFSYYEPCIFNGLYKKGDSIKDIDFFYTDLIAPVKCNDSDEYNDSLMNWNVGEDIKLEFEVGEREGLFEQEQLYAVYSKEEIVELIKSLMDVK